MKELIIAIGLLLFIEGILYALFPSKMKNMLKIIEKLPVSQLRISGLIFATILTLIVTPCLLAIGVKAGNWKNKRYNSNNKIQYNTSTNTAPAK